MCAESTATGTSLTAVLIDGWAAVGEVWADPGGWLYLSDDQMAAIADAAYGSRRFERRLTGGWLERETGSEPLTMARRDVDGAQCYRMPADWLRRHGSEPGDDRSGAGPDSK